MRISGIALALALSASIGARAEEGGNKGAVVLRPGSIEAGAGGRRLALLIGVRAFDDDRWPDLRFTEIDAQDLGNELRDGGAFDTTVLTGAQTKRDDIRRALDALTKQNRSADDVVLVYISTHGTLSRTVDGGIRQVLVLRDTEHAHALNTGLRLDELMRRFDTLPSRRKVLVLATCYSGAGKSSFSDTVSSYLAGMKSAPLQPLYDVSRASIVLSASAWGETAREDEGFGHDIYTHYFMQALHGFDPNGDGAVSVTEAHDFARRQTYRFTEGKQRPTAILTVEGEDPIVLAGRRRHAGKPVLLAYDSHLDGVRVRIDGLEKGELPGGIVLEPGWRDVALMSPDDASEIWRGRVHVASGDRISVTKLMQRDPAWAIDARLGAAVLPRANLGTNRAWLGDLVLRGRRTGWPIEWLDTSIAIGLGFGRDRWQINQERYAVDVLHTRARLGIGSHWALGRIRLHVDGWLGVAYLHRSVHGGVFDGPQRAVSGLVGASTTARLRLSRAWSVGLGGGAFYMMGGADGLTAETALVMTWSQQ